MGERAQASFQALDLDDIDLLLYLVETALYGRSDRSWEGMKASSLIRELREMDKKLTEIGKTLAS